MLAEFQRLRHSSRDGKVRIRMKGEGQEKVEYETVKDAEEALQAPLAGAEDRAIEELEKSFPHLDRCGISRILAKHNGIISEARKEFVTPPMLAVAASATFADSHFLAAYRQSVAPNTIKDLKNAVAELVAYFSHECHCGIGKDRCRYDFLLALEAGLDKNDSVFTAAQRFWTSPVQKCGRRELCSFINQATRTADPVCAGPVAIMVRAINGPLINVSYEGLVRRARPKPLEVKDGFLGTCFRGGGLPDLHKTFFQLHVGKPIRIPNYLATAFKNGDVVNKFLGFAKDDGFPCVRWEIKITTRDGKCYCTHVHFIESVHSKLKGEDEHEFLFVPYSVFTIENVQWSSDPSPENPHVITMLAAEDNSKEELDLPLAPWS